MRGPDLQVLLDAAVADGMPGVSVAVARANEIMWAGAAGMADLQTNDRVSTDMLFGIGSITKSFIAVLCMQLVEEGKLHLDDTVAAVLGSSVEGIPNAQCAGIRELLSHTSGIPSWEDDLTWIRNGRGDESRVDRQWTKTDTLSYIRGKAPLHAAGEGYSYSNTNYTLLGLIIETLTDEDLVKLIRRRILRRIGLRDIYLEGFQQVPRDRLPHRYHRATPQFVQAAGVNAAFPYVRANLIDASESNLSVEWAAGGLLASASELAVYGAALSDGRLLKPHSLQTLMQWQPIAPARQVGRGLFRDQIPGGGALVGHDGGVLGFSATLYWIEGLNLAVAALCNVGSVHSGPAVKSLNALAKSRQFLEAARDCGAK